VVDPDAGWPAGIGRHILDSVDSTMAEAARQAPQLAGPTWICALAQTAARGRRGRQWHNPPGNFAASLVTRPTEPPAQVALRSFVAALALRQALAGLIDTAGAQAQATLGLKWPNDVLLNGGKVAGILLETQGSAARLDRLILGVGVNLRHAPPADSVEPGALRPVSLRQETGVAVTPEAFLTALATAYDGYERQFVRYGFGPIRTEWLRHAARLGERITARTAQGAETVGLFRDVDAAGNLILETAAGPVAIAAADVYF
jgi:BirA family biotin operon repressor/biotin-[acetyl-CoA-carboxylase] ligase